MNKNTALIFGYNEYTFEIEKNIKSVYEHIYILKLGPDGEDSFDLSDNWDSLSQKVNIDDCVAFCILEDMAENIFLTTGNILYSNRSNPMLTIVEDEVGKHDFTLTPCSKDTFKILYNDDNPHHGCQGNFENVLSKWGIKADDIPTAFNVFMNVEFDKTGKISVLPPKSKAGESTTFKAEMDLIIALTACSAGQSNNFNYKPIGYQVTSPS